MATLKEIKRLIDFAEETQLENREILTKYPNTQIASMFNGIGPESFPAWLRILLDAIHPTLAVVACIHDVEWTESDGTRESFTASNRRFFRNGWRVTCASFAGWRPRRYLVAFDAWKFARICQRFGWAAWIAPYEARKATEEA